MTDFCKACNTMRADTPLAELGLRAPNPMVALLSEDRIKDIAFMDDADRHLYYGRLAESVFASPEYQRVIFEVARMEFDKVRGSVPVSAANLRELVRLVVAEALEQSGPENERT